MRKTYQRFKDCRLSRAINFNVVVFLALLMNLAVQGSCFGQSPVESTTQSTSQSSSALSANRTAIHILPEPVTVQEKSGTFIWDKDVVVLVDSKDPNLTRTVEFFLNHLNRVAGTTTQLKIKSGKSASGKSFVIKLNKTAIASLGTEGYQLAISGNHIQLNANKPAGVFYGLQTMMQLLPPAAAGDQFVAASFPIPCAEITDYPRFGWRGLMLDVSRHFFTKDEVKGFIDEMVKYKYNRFHWHLCDDEGWRIEIKTYPQLTQKGAYRVNRTGKFRSFLPPEPGEQANNGGFYTQDDIRDIITYAKERFITILPEIDVPGHSLSLISVFPNLSCSGIQYPVNGGWRFYGKDDNSLCVGKDSTFLVLDKIFTEVAQLFPGAYIHVGGDEAYKGFWDNCPKCKKRMADEHLTSVDQLQSYFVKKVEKILLSKGKKLIGWDEILEGGLAPEATVMSWRGMKGGIQAAQMNHHVIMTPWGNCYLDLYQGETTAEPNSYGLRRLTDAYNFDPVPAGVEEQFILGGQGNVWTENIANVRHLQYMVWPRALALSEVYWSPRSKRNWNRFISSMEANFQRMDISHVKYAKSVYNPILTPEKLDTKDSLQVKLSSELSGTDLYYSFDESNPDQFYPKYDGRPLVFPKGAQDIKVVNYRDGQQIGGIIQVSKTDLQQRIDNKLLY